MCVCVCVCLCCPVCPSHVISFCLSLSLFVTSVMEKFCVEVCSIKCLSASIFHFDHIVAIGIESNTAHGLRYTARAPTPKFMLFQTVLMHGKSL